MWLGVNAIRPRPQYLAFLALGAAGGVCVGRVSRTYNASASMTTVDGDDAPAAIPAYANAYSQIYTICMLRGSALNFGDVRRESGRHGLRYCSGVLVSNSGAQQFRFAEMKFNKTTCCAA
jgi:hypothetical protein